MEISPHAETRISVRLARVIARANIMQAVKGRTYEVGETHVLVATLPRIVTVQDGNDILVGDQVWAVVRHRTATSETVLVTVMLRCAYQPQRGDYVIRP